MVVVVVVMEGGSRIIAVKFISRSLSPALAILCPLEEWCNFSARAIAMDMPQHGVEPSLAPPPRGTVACSRRLPASHHHLKGHAWVRQLGVVVCCVVVALLCCCCCAVAVAVAVAVVVLSVVLCVV